MKRLVMLSPVLLLAACGTPNDAEYCQKMGVANTPEYGACMNYYHDQQAMFDADRAVCSAQADRTYPPSLYDYGGYARTYGGFGHGFGNHGHFYGGQTVRIDPDWHHNRELDALRERIITPCMQRMGWNSGQTWQAGRHTNKTPKAIKQPRSSTLPWLKK